MSNNLSSRLLTYVSITGSLFLGLNIDLGLNFPYGNSFSSFLKCHISWSFLPYSSNSVFNLALSILLAVRTNFRPLDKTGISASERFLLERLITLLLTFLLCILLYYWHYIVIFFINIRSIPSTTNYLILSPLRLNKITNRRLILVYLRRITSPKNSTTLIHCKKDVKILKVWKFRITKCIKIIFEFKKMKSVHQISQEPKVMNLWTCFLTSSV